MQEYKTLNYLAKILYLFSDLKIEERSVGEIESHTLRDQAEGSSRQVRKEKKLNRTAKTNPNTGPKDSESGIMVNSNKTHTVTMIPTIPAPKAVQRALPLTRGVKMRIKTINIHIRK